MYPSHPWLAAPPPYPAQAQPGTATASSQAYVLTLTTLPLSSGHPLPPLPAGYPANYPQLTLLALQFNGLPIYGPLPQPLPSNSLPSNVLSVAPLTITQPQQIQQTQPPKQVQQAQQQKVQQTQPPQQPQQAQLVKQPQPPQQTPNPRVIFHLFAHAEINFNDDFDLSCDKNPPPSPKGKQQCLNVKANFPFMKSVDVLFCSPDSRTALTAYWAFKDQMADVAKMLMMPWEDIRNCGSKEDYAKKITLKAGLTKKVLTTMLKRGNGRGFVVFDSLVHEGWESAQTKVEEEHIIAERADHVRMDLYTLAKVIQVPDGKWKTIMFNSSKTAKTLVTSVDKHIVIISHRNFLTHLTRRDGVPDTTWETVQYRSYEFPSDVEAAKNPAEMFNLVETAESKARKHVKDGGPPPAGK